MNSVVVLIVKLCGGIVVKKGGGLVPLKCNSPTEFSGADRTNPALD